MDRLDRTDDVFTFDGDAFTWQRDGDKSSPNKCKHQNSWTDPSTASEEGPLKSSNLIQGTSSTQEAINSKIEEEWPLSAKMNSESTSLLTTDCGINSCKVADQNSHSSPKDELAEKQTSKILIKVNGNRLCSQRCDVSLQDSTKEHGSAEDVFVEDSAERNSFAEHREKLIRMSGSSMRKKQLPSFDEVFLGVKLDKQKPRVSFADTNADQKKEEEDEYLAVLRNRKDIKMGMEKQISTTDLTLAAALVYDAMEGRTSDFKTEARFVRSYNLYRSKVLTYLLYLFIFLNLSLAIFEKPAVKIVQCPFWAPMVVETLCVLYFAFRAAHHIHFRSKNLHEDAKLLLVIVILVLTVIDMICYVVIRSVRWSRPLRPLLIIFFQDGRQIRRPCRNIRKTFRVMIPMVLLLYAFIFIFALIAWKFFSKRDDLVYPDGSPYFKDFWESVWDLYVLVTTSNNPDIMMPAYDSNRLYCILFTVYVIGSLYLFLNIFLAVTYQGYRENMKNELQQSLADKRAKLTQAFEVLKINRAGEEMVTYRTWVRLIQLADPRKTKSQIDLLMMILDLDKSGHISRSQFMNVADLLNVPLSEVKDRLTLCEKYLPALFHSKPSVMLRDFVNSLLFMYLFDVIIVVNIILIAMDIHDADWVFYGLFQLEILMKLYTNGYKKFFHKVWNWVDAIITGVSLVCLIILGTDATDEKNETNIITVVNIFRIFRVLRFLVHFYVFKTIFRTLVNISLSIITYCAILFVIFYVFAIVGMEIFQDKVQFLGHNYSDPSQMYCGNKALNGSDFYKLGYCNNNFNDIFNAYVVLSELTIVNNWHVITDGFVRVTNKWARLYFASFHLVIVLVTMNILSAFILDMFMYEYTIQKMGKIDSVVDAKIKELGLGLDDETGMEISSPMSAAEVKAIQSPEILAMLNAQNESTQGKGAKSQRKQKRRSALDRLSHFGQTAMRSSTPHAPTLSRYDGIKFHLKRKGWMKVELLLQQLFLEEMENDDKDFSVKVSEA